MIIDWDTIDTVLLDMDGTILDRHFDDHFWLEHAPKRWAERNNTTIEYAKEHLYDLFRSQENTLNWTDLDYWSDRLKLDIPVLKQEVEHLIAVHPYVIEFLLFLKHTGKKIWLVTNAHSKTLDLKMKRTRIGPYFDGIISAHQVGLPKEDERFWGKLQDFIRYDPERTLLGEDSETNLATAKSFSIRYLIYISRYSSKVEPRKSEQFTTIDYFNRLIPESGSCCVTIK
ncbi:MAG: GMP/IMP nucleotidase [Desulfuromonadaceae bacterium]|nr:GMP/IMP nucleotidase [Desulfuromonadaceae bacterium]MDD2849317.1 GMP/IMP nucleotidase [Desulfuromonadaceae bacterium]MDD4129376.1 GMP/IMP nucleotidase [Desulfuromonadaceae bacterium]